MSGYSGALIEFDNDSRDFVLGVEIGRLWEQLKAGDEVVQIVHADNAEMLIRLGEATHRSYSAEPLDDNWMEVTFAAAEGTTP